MEQVEPEVHQRPRRRKHVNAQVLLIEVPTPRSNQRVAAVSPQGVMAAVEGVVGDGAVDRRQCRFSMTLDLILSRSGLLASSKSAMKPDAGVQGVDDHLAVRRAGDLGLGGRRSPSGGSGPASRSPVPRRYPAGSPSGRRVGRRAARSSWRRARKRRYRSARNSRHMGQDLGRARSLSFASAAMVIVTMTLLSSHCRGCQVLTPDRAVGTRGGELAQKGSPQRRAERPRGQRRRPLPP